MNDMYKFSEQTIKENTDIPKDDELLAFLQQSVVDEDEYLRYRISERFNIRMVSLFEAHKKDRLPPEQSDMKEQIETYLDTQKTVFANKAKAILMCKQLGLNTAKLNDEEWRVLIKTLESSAPVRRVKKRK